MMKKRIAFIVLSCIWAAATYSQTSVSSLYGNFSREENVEKVNLGGLVMAMAKPFMEKGTAGVKISSVNVLSLESCTPEVKDRFNRQARDFKDKDYELFVNSNENNEKTRIFLKFEKDFIREMVIITTGNEPSLVRLKGKIRPSDIENIRNEKR